MPDKYETEVAVELLRKFAGLGFRAKLEPDAVVLRVGTLEVASPHSPGTLKPTHQNTAILLDGVEIQRRLRAVTVRLAVGEVNSAELTLDIVP